MLKREEERIECHHCRQVSISKQSQLAKSCQIKNVSRYFLSVFWYICQFARRLTARQSCHPRRAMILSSHKMRQRCHKMLVHAFFSTCHADRMPPLLDVFIFFHIYRESESEVFTIQTFYVKVLILNIFG